jgi:acyl-coenzyme A synthetase/AMP-(fatty) acid ligase
VAGTLLIDRVLAWAERTPGAPAMIWSDRSVSYRLLRASLASAVRHLQGEGIGPGLTVGVDMRQGPLHLVALLALARLGAVIVPLFSFVRPEDRDALIRDFAIDAVLADYPANAPEGCKVVVMQTLLAKGDDPALDASGFTPDAATPLRIGLTSGTAGPRKGILLTHGAFMRRLGRRFYGEGAPPRVIPPLLHVTSALQLAAHALCAGGAVVFPSGEENADFVAAIRRHGVTHVTMPAVHLSFILDTLPSDHAPFASLTHVRLQGGMPSPAFIEHVRRRFSPHVHVPYSATEVGVIAMATPETLAVAPQSSGRVAPGARLEIVGEDGRAVAPGVSGEIRVQVDGMPTGYAGADQGTPPRFRGGWFYPQDRGRLGAEGLLYVEGRVDDVINLGGRKLSPRHAEAVLEDFPGVREAAVYAFEDDAGTVRIAADVVASSELDWKGLEHHARLALDVFAPERYRAVPSLPRNAAGKLRRHVISRNA